MAFTRFLLRARHKEKKAFFKFIKIQLHIFKKGGAGINNSFCYLHVTSLCYLQADKQNKPHLFATA